MPSEEVKPKPPQSAENAQFKPGKHVMPGIVDDIVWEFRRKKNVIPYPRTISKNRGFEQEAILPALVHALFEKISSIDERQALLEDHVKSMSVREYQSLRRAA